MTHLPANIWWNRRRERLDGLMDLLAYANGAAVLDVGCNRGLVGYEFANKGAMLVHGCDISTAGIETARRMFDDVIECESRFEVVDLAQGVAGLSVFGHETYDIVLLLGVYHKIKRAMSGESLSGLIQYLGDKTTRFFAWNGFEEERVRIDADLAGRMACVHWSRMSGHHTAVWERI